MDSFQSELEHLLEKYAHESNPSTPDGRVMELIELISTNLKNWKHHRKMEKILDDAKTKKLTDEELEKSIAEDARKEMKRKYG